MRTIIFVTISLLFFILSCSEKTADLDQVDIQIKQKNYALAKQFLLAEQKKSFSDTLQYARINTRLKRIDHLLYFNDLENYALQKNWAKAEQVWIRKQIELSDSPANPIPDYYFSLFHWRAVIDSALNSPDSAQAYLQKAIRIPTTQRYLLQTDLEKLGFILAEQDSLVAARRLFDQSLRMLRISKLDKELQQIYYLYMDGKFGKCREQLKGIPDSLKSERWKNLQLFLEKFSEQLALDERFKLW